MILSLSSRFVASAAGLATTTVTAVAATALGLVAGAASSADAVTPTSPWLAGGQMPQNAYFHFQAQPQERRTTSGQFQWLFTCGPTNPTHALGSSSVSLEPYKTNAHGVQGVQILFHFSSTAKAKAALKSIEADYASCAPRLNRMYDFTTGKLVHSGILRTASVQDGISYRVEIRNVLNHPAEVADLPSDAQEFFVQRGNTVSFVQIDGTNRYLDVTTGAQQTLKTMAARLG